MDKTDLRTVSPKDCAKYKSSDRGKSPGKGSQRDAESEADIIAGGHKHGNHVMSGVLCDNNIKLFGSSGHSFPKLESSPDEQERVRLANLKSHTLEEKNRSLRHKRDSE